VVDTLSPRQKAAGHTAAKPGEPIFMLKRMYGNNPERFQKLYFIVPILLDMQRKKKFRFDDGQGIAKSNAFHHLHE
jgi:hypothetical protein